METERDWGVPECGDASVDALLRFVDARLRETSRSTPPGALDESHQELELLGRYLMDQASGVCRADTLCQLPSGTLGALRRIARLHDDHPDFEPAWSRR